MFSFNFKSGDVGKFVEQFKNLSKAQQIALLTSESFDAQQKQYLATSAGLTITESGQVVATQSLAGAQTAATASTSGLSAAMTGLGASLKSAFVSLATNPFTYLIAGLVTGGIALHKYMTAFDNAIEKAQESQSAYESTASEIDSLKSETESYKETLTSLADEYEVKITGDEDVSDLIEKLKSADLSLEDEATLSQIKSQNAELERQIALKQQLADQQSQQAVDDAIEALKIEHTQDMTQQYTTTDKTGMVKTTQNRQTTILEASKNELQALREYKEQRDALFNDGIVDTTQTEQFESLDAEIEKYTNDITANIEQLNTLKASFEDENGLMREGLSQEAQDYYNAILAIIDGFNNIDLSPAEQQLNAIESFFDGSTGKNYLKDELLEVAESGDITTDTLSRMGLSLEDLGLSGEEGLSALNRYFKDIVNSANEANKSVEEFDGSVESITTASESEDQDATWDKVSELYKAAKELDKNKKWGTDDFQSMARFIAPEGAFSQNSDLKAQDYKDIWDKYSANFQKYFDSENPLQSAINTQEKLISSGLGTKSSDGIIAWSDSFKSSADAAKAMGISVEAAEVAMHNLESYGAEFDGVIFSNERLDEYKSSLDGIREIYDSMEEGSHKDWLGNLIEGFD